MSLIYICMVPLLSMSCKGAAPHPRIGPGERLQPAATGGLVSQAMLAGRARLYSLENFDELALENSSRARTLPYRSPHALYTGLDLLALSNFSILKGRSYALLANATGRDRHMEPILSLLLKANLPPTLLLEPEHGFFGAEDTPAGDKLRSAGPGAIKILSLYGKTTRKPTSEQLEGIDLIVVDLQNLPVRCYTFVTTLTHLMEAAEENNIELLILDRPNPYGIWKAQGSPLHPDYTGFVGLAPVPFLYSLTLGEYALYMSARRFKNLRLRVIKVQDYRREDLSANLRNAWVNPSPNIPNLESALVYPGVVFFEGANVSLGRGTSRPFVYSGAPWMRAGEVLSEMRKLNLPGVQLGLVRFIPTSSHYKDKTCQGIQIIPRTTDFDTLRTGYEYMRIVRRLHPEKFKLTKRRGKYFVDLLWGGPDFRAALMADLSWSEFKSMWANHAEKFEKEVAAFRLY